jgi:serine/threonine protein kinase/formylglycine-generating enzyme required for sulfatase activity
MDEREPDSESKTQPPAHQHDGKAADPDPLDDRLFDLLEAWEEEYLRGRELSAASLAGDDPVILAALKSRIEQQKRLRVYLRISPGAPLAAPSDQIDHQRRDSCQKAPAPDQQGRGAIIASAPSVPTSIGRYQVIRLLGQGSFGQVYLARDAELDRDVAIKVPVPGGAAQFLDVDSYLREARILARLAHPNVVPVYDVGRTEDGRFYVVSKYMEGGDLAVRLRGGRLTFAESAELIAVLCGALHYTHTQDLFHRDIKPANILLDAAGAPSLADFGLALKDENLGQGARHVGTAAYMSPEQARGEGHLVDGRSDIFSIGIVLYELLTGRRPFRGGSNQEVMQQIKSAEPRPPRQIDDKIPSELERICLKALSKRASERYTTARDLAEDLRHFLRSGPVTVGKQDTAPVPTPAPIPVPTAPMPEPPSTQVSVPSEISGRSIRIVPKGLCSFDEDDADFFVELVPGPRGRDGLPDVLRFWKTRIDTLDRDRTFRVGLIYGPSGCGKSSLVKAGLLPRLGRHVAAIYVEATAAHTEDRLLRGLTTRFPELPATAGLAGCMTLLRRGRVLPRGHKVLLVLDQFEQWLFAHGGDAEGELTAALRQCDGEHLQALCLLRDDFWMAATRFMKELEIDLVPDRNVAAVDLFDQKHTRKVLAAFGTAYDALPPQSGEFSKEQKTFLDEAVAALVQDGRVVPVRLALFAEMVKDKPWTPATLRKVHGMEGVGVRFLEDTFSSSRSNPNHRYHQKAAQAVLKSLLPEANADIKGRMRSVEELRSDSGYRDRPGDFVDLIRMLDTELRLITPVDLESSIEENTPSPTGQDRYYQLTHDYLVHALRDWLTRKQRETRRGRAELLLAERSAFWTIKPENRYLPSFREWTRIGLLTKREVWTESQRRMMRRGVRVHGLRLFALFALLALTASGIVAFNIYSRTHELLVDLARAQPDRKPQFLDQLARYPRWVYLSRLRALARQPGNDELAQLGYSLGLLPDDPEQLVYLFRRLLDAEPDELAILRDRVLPGVRDVSPEVLADLRNAVKFRDGELTEPDAVQEQRAERRARAAALLVRLGHGGEVSDLLQHSDRPRSRSAFIHALSDLRADPAVLAGELDRLIKSADTSPVVTRSSAGKNAYLFDRGASRLRALIQVLAGCRAEDRAALDPRMRDELVAKLASLHGSHPDAGVHSAAELAIKRWGFPDRLSGETGQPPKAGEPIRQRWYVNRERQTMVLVDGPVVFEMGSPPSDPEGQPDEVYHRREIRHRFGIAAKEVTNEEFERYARAVPGAGRDYRHQYSPHQDGPRISLTWFECIAYCNWLSDGEGLPRCYLPNTDGKFTEGVRVDAEAVAKGGYRLPTEAELEYACRAATVTSRYYGDRPDLLKSYEWYVDNSGNHAHPCGERLPNDFGLFDLLGNVMEWCHDRYSGNWLAPKGVALDVITPETIGSDQRIFRGQGFNNGAAGVRSAVRDWQSPLEKKPDLGLRPARTIP